MIYSYGLLLFTIPGSFLLIGTRNMGDSLQHSWNAHSSGSFAKVGTLMRDDSFNYVGTVRDNDSFY